MHSRYILTPALLLLSACAGAQFNAEKPGVTPEQFQVDNATCIDQSRTGGGFVFGPAILILPAMLAMQGAAQEEADRRFANCMRVRGYTITEKVAP